MEVPTPPTGEPAPTVAADVKPSLVKSTVLTRDGNEAAACSVFLVGVIPNMTSLIVAGDQRDQKVIYNLSETGKSTRFGEFRTRQMLNWYRSGELWLQDPPHPFLFACLALASLEPLVEHLHTGRKFRSHFAAPQSRAAYLMPEDWPEFQRDPYETPGAVFTADDKDIIRTELVDVALALIAAGATFYPELTSPSERRGLYWLHFNRWAPPFEPEHPLSCKASFAGTEGQIEKVDLKAALLDTEAHPRLACGIAAVQARSKLKQYQQDGEIWLFRDKPLRGQITSFSEGMHRVDNRKTAYIPKRTADKDRALLDKVRKHMKNNA